MSKKKKIVVFFLYNKLSLAACMRRGRGVLKGLVMWAAEGNVIFI